MTIRLSPEDQSRVDGVTREGSNRTERKPVRMGVLLLIILLVLTLLSLFSYGIAVMHGVV